jgi:hypothetical protein
MIDDIFHFLFSDNDYPQKEKDTDHRTLPAILALSFYLSYSNNSTGKRILQEANRANKF